MVSNKMEVNKFIYSTKGKKLYSALAKLSIHKGGTYLNRSGSHEIENQKEEKLISQ